MKIKKLGNTEINIPVIGQGCMGIGGDFSADYSSDSEQIKALELGIDLGMTLIDTSEVYGAGHSEELVGKVAKRHRSEICIATKFAPENNSYNGIIKAANKSLQRLDTDYIDIYQVHWPNPAVPVSETMQALEELVKSGKVRCIGLSNFSVKEMREAQDALGSEFIVSNQVEYNLFDRFIEQSILPYCETKNITVMAYSPLDKGRIVEHGEAFKLLSKISMKHGCTVSQIILNWLICQSSVIVIPKAVKEKHIRENAVASDFELSGKELDDISRVCSGTPEYIPTDHIKVSLEGEGNRKVYQTLQQAHDNLLGFSPSPRELSEFICQGEPTKPVRLVPTKDTSGKYKYDLIEGRIRYWAWVIAHEERKPIPAYIR